MALCKPATLSAVWGRGKITTGTFHPQASLQVQRETLSLIGQRVIQQDICSLSLTSMNMLLHTHMCLLKDTCVHTPQTHVCIYHRNMCIHPRHMCAHTTATCVHAPQTHTLPPYTKFNYLEHGPKERIWHSCRNSDSFLKARLGEQ